MKCRTEQEAKIPESERQNNDAFRLALALHAAQGEYQLEAFDRVVLRRYGSRAPFPQLYKDHQRRVTALQYLCRKYHLENSKSSLPKPVCPKEWPEVLRVELALLRGNLAVYENLLVLPVHDGTVERVLKALHNETEQTHLPLVLAALGKYRVK